MLFYVDTCIALMSVIIINLFQTVHAYSRTSMLYKYAHGVFHNSQNFFQAPVDLKFRKQVTQNKLDTQDGI